MADMDPEVAADVPIDVTDDPSERLRHLTEDLQSQLTAARADSLASDKWLARLQSIETRLSMVESSVRTEAERLRASVASVDDLAASVNHHLDRAVGAIVSVSDGFNERLDRMEESLAAITTGSADPGSSSTGAVRSTLQEWVDRLERIESELVRLVEPAAPIDPAPVVNTARDDILAALARLPEPAEPVDPAPLVDSARDEILAALARIADPAEPIDPAPLVSAARDEILAELAAHRSAIDSMLTRTGEDLEARLSATGLELASGVGALRRDLTSDTWRTEILAAVAALKATVDSQLDHTTAELTSHLAATSEQLTAGVDDLKRDLGALDAIQNAIDKLHAAAAEEPEPRVGAVGLVEIEVALRSQLSEQSDVMRSLQLAHENVAASLQASATSTSTDLGRLADRVAALSGEIEVLRQHGREREGADQATLLGELESSLQERLDRIDHAVAAMLDAGEPDIELFSAQLDALGRLIQLVVRSVHLIEEATVGVTEGREADHAAAAGAIARLRTLRR